MSDATGSRVCPTCGRADAVEDSVSPEKWAGYCYYCRAPFPHATPDRAAMTKLLADEIERWLQSDRIGLMYATEIMRGESVTREAAEDLAAILTETLGASHA